MRSCFLPILLFACSNWCFSVVQAQLPDQLNTRGIEFPEFRYRQYQFLDDATLEKIEGLGYTQENWDKPGTNTAMENIGFEGAGLSQSSILDLGFTAEVWDCYINHYIYYDWSDLETLGVQEYMIALGWSRDNWRKTDQNSVYSLYWEELTVEQQGNATEICYFQYTWDYDILEVWTTDAPTGSPTMAPTNSTDDDAASTSVVGLATMASLGLALL